jgi:hypothetical protein
MTSFNTPSQVLNEPTTRLGFWGRLWRRFREARIEKAMYRFAPTRKM